MVRRKLSAGFYGSYFPFLHSGTERWHCLTVTGRMRTCFSFARGIMICPAVTSVSLFARAISFPCLHSCDGRTDSNHPHHSSHNNLCKISVAASKIPSMPLTIRTSRSRTAKPVLSLFLLPRRLRSGWNSRICCSSKVNFRPAARAVTEYLSGDALLPMSVFRWILSIPELRYVSFLSTPV